MSVTKEKKLPTLDELFEETKKQEQIRKNIIDSFFEDKIKIKEGFSQEEIDDAKAKGYCKVKTEAEVDKQEKDKETEYEKLKKDFKETHIFQSQKPMLEDLYIGGIGGSLVWLRLVQIIRDMLVVYIMKLYWQL